MKRFHFPLERVLRWRGEQADLQAMKLERLFAELNSIERQREELIAERSQAERILTFEQPISAEELYRLDSFRQYVQARCMSLDQLEREQAGKIAQQRQCLMEATRQYELLDRLRKKNLLQWTAANDKQQEALAAELFLGRRRGPSTLP